MARGDDRRGEEIQRTEFLRNYEETRWAGHSQEYWEDQGWALEVIDPPPRTGVLGIPNSGNDDRPTPATQYNWTPPPEQEITTEQVQQALTELLSSGSNTGQPPQEVTNPFQLAGETFNNINTLPSGLPDVQYQPKNQVGSSLTGNTMWSAPSVPTPPAGPLSPDSFLAELFPSGGGGQGGGDASPGDGPSASSATGAGISASTFGGIVSGFGVMTGNSALVAFGQSLQSLNDAVTSTESPTSNVGGFGSNSGAASGPGISSAGTSGLGGFGMGPGPGGPGAGATGGPPGGSGSGGAPAGSAAGGI